MNQFEIQILVARVVMLNLLDGEVERGLVAFVVQDGQDINTSAECLAEERGAVLLRVETPQSATLYNLGLKEHHLDNSATPKRSDCNSQL